MAQQKQVKARDGASLWRDVGGKSIWLARQPHDIGGVGGNLPSRWYTSSSSVPCHLSAINSSCCYSKIKL